MIDLTSIYVSNGIGLGILITTAFCNMSLLRSKRKDIRCLWIITVGTILGCIVDPIVFTVDGVDGTLQHWVNILGNTYLYYGNTWLAVLWNAFLIIHLMGKGKEVKKRIRILSIFPAMLTILSTVNIFYPCVFIVGEDNVYSRLPLSWLYWIGLSGYLLYSIIMYLNFRKNRTRVRFFPIGVFILPVAMGVLIQALHYGISLTWPSVGIALSGVMMCIKTEAAYVDQLTGIHSRAFLFTTTFYQKMSGVIMFDINSFKEINDRYGHAEGDKALIQVAGVLAEAALDKGFAVRYAGDEFLIVCRNENLEGMRAICHDVDRQLEAINQQSKKPYQLSVSYGFDQFYTDYDNLDTVVRRTDQKMYEAKKKYYQEKHDRRNRATSINATQYTMT